jgi:hypothetical protein
MYSFFIPALAVISFSVLTSWFINTEIVTALFDGRLLSPSSLHPLLYRQTIRHSQGNDKEKLYSNTRGPAACILSHIRLYYIICLWFVGSSCVATTMDYNEFLLNFSGVSFHISVWLGLEIPSDRFHYIFYFTRTLKSEVSYIIIFSLFLIIYLFPPRFCCFACSLRPRRPCDGVAGRSWSYFACVVTSKVSAAAHM